jgi:hypothetical protein
VTNANGSLFHIDLAANRATDAIIKMQASKLIATMTTMSAPQSAPSIILVSY